MAKKSKNFRLMYGWNIFMFAIPCQISKYSLRKISLKLFWMCVIVLVLYGMPPFPILRTFIVFIKKKFSLIFDDLTIVSLREMVVKLRLPSTRYEEMIISPCKCWSEFHQIISTFKTKIFSFIKKRSRLIVHIQFRKSFAVFRKKIFMFFFLQIFYVGSNVFFLTHIKSYNVKISMIF